MNYLPKFSLATLGFFLCIFLACKDGKEPAYSPENQVTSFGEKITFSKGEAMAVIPESMVKTLEQYSNNLKANPNTKISITGNFSNGENKVKNQQNLGIQRANAIAIQLRNLGVKPAQIDLFSKEYPDGSIFDGITIEMSLKDLPKATEKLIIQDGDQFRLVAPVSFVFKKNGDQLFMPKEVQAKMKDLIAYVSSSNRKLVLTGIEDLSLENTPKLAEKRAYNLGEKLMKMGLKKNEIGYKVSQGKGLKEKDGFIQNAVLFSFEPK